MCLILPSLSLYYILMEFTHLQVLDWSPHLHIAVSVSEEESFGSTLKPPSAAKLWWWHIGPAGKWTGGCSPYLRSNVRRENNCVRCCAGGKRRSGPGSGTWPVATSATSGEGLKMSPVSYYSEAHLHKIWYNHSFWLCALGGYYSIVGEPERG